MGTAPGSMSIAQVAFSALTVEATTAWYRDMLGFEPAGGAGGIQGPEVEAMMGLPECECEMHWLTDTNDFFQLEFFSFRAPAPVPGGRRPDEAGWSLVGFAVDDLDAVLGRLGGVPTGPVLGTGAQRRVCVRDPEGVWLELRQLDRPSARTVREGPVTTAFVRAVVADHDRARDFFCGALGLRDTAAPLHTPEDERLWGGIPAITRSSMLTAEGDPGGLAIELVQYTERVPRPLPDGYRICDQGLLNVAFGSRSPEDYEATVARVRAGGYRLHGELAVGPARARYIVGTDDLSVELLTIPDRKIEEEFGFLPTAAPGA